MTEKLQSSGDVSRRIGTKGKLFVTNPNFNGNATAEGDWVFRIADWAQSIGVSYLFLINHHLRITARWMDEDGVRWYQIFDTTAKRGHADHQTVSAAEIEKHCRLVKRPPAYAIPGILARVPRCRYLPYSIYNRQDCESIQRWIETGEEKYRFSPQVWTAVALVAFSLGFGVYQAYRPKPQRRRNPRRS